MSVTSIYPVLMSTDVPATSRFFRDLLGFEPTFETDWYVSLKRDAWELAILHPDHETIPAGRRGTAAGGLLINVEVDSADAEWQRLVVDGPLEPLLELRSEPFGQRHFIVAGPEGVLVDVIEEIEPDETYAEAFAVADQR